MPEYVIRKVRLAHCKKSPEICPQCREMKEERVCLLDVDPPRPGEIQRRVIEIGRGEKKRWREYEIARVFKDVREARDCARRHGVEDIEI